MSDPRNVTPGMATEPRPEPGGDRRGGGDRGTRTGTDASDRGWGSGGSAGGNAARGFEFGFAGRNVPWLGILLLLVGGVLLLEQLFPGVRFRTILIIGLGVAFAVGYVLSRSRWLVTPAFLFLGLGAGLLLTDLGAVRGSAWPLTLGVAMLALWGIGQATHRPRGWALLIGGLLTVIGVVQLSGQIPGLPDLGNLWPALLIIAGAGVLLRGRSGQRRDVL